MRLRLKRFHQPVRAFIGLSLAVAAELDDKPGVAFGKHRAALGRHSFVMHIGEHARIEPFERNRVVRVAERDLIARCKDVGKSKDGERPHAAGSARVEASLRSNSDAGALRSDQRACHVESPSREVVRRVA